jgi:hypothetical protein
MINCPRCSNLLLLIFVGSRLYGCKNCIADSHEDFVGDSWILYLNENQCDIYTAKYRLSFSKQELKILSYDSKFGFDNEILKISKNNLSYSSFKSSKEIDAFVERHLIFS